MFRPRLKLMTVKRLFIGIVCASDNMDCTKERFGLASSSLGHDHERVKKNLNFFQTTFAMLNSHDVVMALWLCLVYLFLSISSAEDLYDLWRISRARLNDKPLRTVMHVIITRRHSLPELWDFLHPFMIVTVGLKDWKTTYLV